MRARSGKRTEGEAEEASEPDSKPDSDVEQKGEEKKEMDEKVALSSSGGWFSGLARKTTSPDEEDAGKKSEVQTETSSETVSKSESPVEHMGKEEKETDDKTMSSSSGGWFGGLTRKTPSLEEAAGKKMEQTECTKSKETKTNDPETTKDDLRSPDS